MVVQVYPTMVQRPVAAAQVDVVAAVLAPLGKTLGPVLAQLAAVPHKAQLPPEAGQYILPQSEPYVQGVAAQSPDEAVQLELSGQRLLPVSHWVQTLEMQAVWAPHSVRIEA